MRPSRISEHGTLVAARRRELRVELVGIAAAPGHVVFEVGCGHGHFLVAYAAAHPDVQCVGIDISADRIARANRKRERAGLANLRFVRAEGDDFLAAMPGELRFSAVYILFPDPWPKRRHHKNRLMKPAFLSAVAAAAAKGACLYFRTDHEPYFRDVAAILRDHPDWRVSEAGALPFEEATVFEKRAERHFTLVAALCERRDSQAK